MSIVKLLDGVSL